MFSEYLSSHPMPSLLSDAPYRPYPAAEDRGAWTSLPPPLISELRQMAQDFHAQPYPMRLASGFLAFVENGSRKADEEPYFFRRRKLCAAVLQCCLDEKAPLRDVIDGVWCVCEESSWVISAHNVNAVPGAPAPAEYPLPDPDRPYIDLFSAQTGMILSLAVYLLHQRLNAVSPMIAERVQREIRLRILAPFMGTDDFWWMGVRRKDLCNWTPWIISNVMRCACLYPMEKESRAALLDKACRILDRWLAVVPRDGGCDEGAGYWNMAGGALLDCLQILETVTHGKMAFWQAEKVKNILMFPLKAEIGGGWFLNFADCDAKPALSGERLQYAGERMNAPSLIAMGSRFRGGPARQLEDVPHFSRLLDLLFHPAPDAQPEEKPGDVWLPDLQVRIVRRGMFTLCCKGGHNGENHNHNDVGSFMLYADGEPQIVDAGNMTYTAKTFSSQRYTLWNVRSAYHNLPLIGGCEQQPGRECAARDVRFLPDGLSLDIAKTYGQNAGALRAQREARLSENGLAILDTIQLKEKKPVAWVFMLRHRPAFFLGGFSSGAIRAEYPAGLHAEAEEIPIGDPRMARNFPGSLWRVTLSAPAEQAFKMAFLFRRKAEDA
ncbi:MAG: heparinase II/III family protein [Clostridia bacterium]|nr:heparinase II/III family protein [Clostridia bacterium]